MEDRPRHQQEKAGVRENQLENVRKCQAHTARDLLIANAKLNAAQVTRSQAYSLVVQAQRNKLPAQQKRKLLREAVSFDLALVEARGIVTRAERVFGAADRLLAFWLKDKWNVMNEGRQQHEAACNISRGHGSDGLPSTSKIMTRNQKPEDLPVKGVHRGKALFGGPGEVDNSYDVLGPEPIHPAREIEAESPEGGASGRGDAAVSEGLRKRTRYRSPSVETVTDGSMP
jgi:hypothetical protein